MRPKFACHECFCGRLRLRHAISLLIGEVYKMQVDTVDIEEGGISQRQSASATLAETSQEEPAGLAPVTECLAQMTNLRKVSTHIALQKISFLSAHVRAVCNPPSRPFQ